MNLACEYDFTGQTSGCLHFYYHMVGSAIGSLDVLINGGCFPIVGQQQANQAAPYIAVNVDLAAYMGQSNVLIEIIEQQEILGHLI